MKEIMNDTSNQYEHGLQLESAFGEGWKSYPVEMRETGIGL